MNFSRKSFYCIILTLLLVINTPVFTFASEETITIKAAMSEDESIIVERILYTALNRLEYQMVSKTAGMRTTVNDVNYGDAAVVPAQAIGLEEEYPNLIRIPVPISYVETNVYTRSDAPYEFTSWSDLTGLRLSHCWKNTYITRNVPRADASEVVTLNEYDDLWNSLLANETDVAVIPNLTGFVRIVPNGVKMAGVIEREPRYTYVNKNYEFLVPLLTEVYQNMTDDGTMEMIRTSQQSGDKQIVLHISSYSTRVEWERNETDAIRKSLEEIPNLEYHNLNLSARQISNKANMNAIIANTIRTNFIERNPDLIIATDNDALEFVLNNYYMLFPKVPVVFCGINAFDISMLYGFEEYFTGVSEEDSSYETIAEILRLYPKTERIYILNDYTPSGLKWREGLEKRIDTYGFPVRYEFNENKPFNDILEDIRGFGPDTLVLLGTYFLDSGKAFYTEKDVQELVSEASQMPVFCLANSFNGYGSLGGLVTAGDLQGETAGLMAQKILSGIRPDEIPVIIDSSSLNRWQFDYEVAGKHGINVKTLPPEHIAVNRKLPIWESNPNEFYLALVIIGASLVIIVGLALFLKLMRQKNMRLLEIQSHLHSAEELLEKDNDLCKMIDSLPVPVLIVNIEACKLEYGNQAFLSVNGFSSFKQAEQLDLTPLVKTAFNLWLDKSVSFTYGNLREQDSEICQRISAEKLMYNNKNCLALICEDITAQLKETEMLSRAAQKEREANKAKSAFLSRMSHEIRTPINAINGMTAIAKAANNHEKIMYSLEKIDSASKHLLGIINDILDMAKIESGKLELDYAPIDVQKMIDNIVNIIKFRAENKKQSLTVEVGDDVPKSIISDELRISQVITNLLSNAHKFTPENGKIVLRVMKQDELNGSCTIQFTVEDNGIGVSAEQQTRIFAAFEQASGSISRVYGGTGLGLAISKQLVELMEGEIWLESELGQGSKFNFTINAKECDMPLTDEESQAGKPVMSNAFKGQTILLVDDVDVNREIIAAVLEDTGANIIPAENGLKAVELFKKDPVLYNLILMDIHMPEMDGYEATGNIRSLNCDEAKNVPIIAMTADVFKEDIEHCLEAGMDDHIGKPVDVEELFRKLYKRLQQF